MNDLADDGFHEIQLSGKQLVFLFMATTIVAVVIFLCGVQVGRQAVKSDRPGEASDTVASASTPPAATTPSQPAASSGPPAAEPPAPAPEPDDELSYAKRLQGDQPASADRLKPPSPASQASAAKPGVPPASQVSAPKGGVPPASQVSAPKAGVPPSIAAQPPAQASSGKPASAKEASPASAPQSAAKPGGWIVQITALQDRGACVAIAQRLVAKGYPAFVMDPAAGSPKIYRVQVGGYPDREKADQAARRLATEEQFKTYVRSR